MTAPHQSSRLGVGIISAGRVGAVLGSALRAAGHTITGVAAVSQASRERAESLLPGVEVVEPQVIVERSQLVLLAVPDQDLPALVQGLADVNAWQMGQIVAHTSGRYGISVLQPAMTAGAIGLAIHPAMTFSGLSMDLPRLTGCRFGVTALPAFLPIAQALAVEMGGEPVVIAEADRATYHAALAHASNHLVTLTAQARQVLESLGIDDPGRLLRPLTETALDRALDNGDSALTGPVVRGDAETVAVHLEALERADASNHDAAPVAGTYRSLARATVDRLAAQGRLKGAELEALNNVLGQEAP